MPTMFHAAVQHCAIQAKSVLKTRDPFTSTCHHFALEFLTKTRRRDVTMRTVTAAAAVALAATTSTSEAS